MPVTAAPGSSESGTGSGSDSSNPLPANVSALLNTVYQEYKNGDLPTTTQAGQVEIQGTNVGVQLRTANPSDFNAMVAAAQSLGLQVQTSSAAYDIVIGFLPINELPAAAQLAGSPAITPLLYPTVN
jgi:hypothetical protein